MTLTGSLLVWGEFQYVFIVLHRMNLCFEVPIQSLFLVYLKITTPLYQ